MKTTESDSEADGVNEAQRGNLNGLADDLRRRIAEAAYELYERRGREDGRDVMDWLQAEAIVTDQYPTHP